MKNLDLCIGALIFALSIAGTFYNYRTIQTVEVPSFTFFEGLLQRGENSFSIRSSKRCVGEITFSLDGAETLTLQGSSALRVSAEQLIAEANASFNAVFNPLKQFSGGELSLRFSETHLKLRAGGTNPIVVSATWKGFGQEKSFEFPFKGPLAISEFEKGKYRLEYPFSSSFNPVLNHPILAIAQQKLKLSVRRVEEGATDACAADEPRRLKLDEIIKTLRNFSSFPNTTP